VIILYVPGSLAEIDAETAVLDAAGGSDTTWEAHVKCPPIFVVFSSHSTFILA
jgi:hypothetical protein